MLPNNLYFDMEQIELSGFGYRPDKKPAAVFCDAGLIADPDPSVKIKNPSTLGCTWAYLWVDENYEYIVRHGWGAVLVPGMTNCFNYPYAKGFTSIENNLAELIAAIHALRELPIGWDGAFYCDNEVTIGRIFGLNGKRWQMNGVPQKTIDAVKIVTQSLGEVETVLLHGHPTQAQIEEGYGDNGKPTSIFNVVCDSWNKKVSKAILERYVPPRKKEACIES